MPSNRFNLKVLLLLSSGHLVTDLYQGALPVILPFLKAKLLLSYTATGVILLVGSLTSSVIQPLFGYISDRKEKPLFLPLGCLCAGLGFSMLSVPESFALVVPLVVLSGLGIASYHPEGFRTAHFFTGEKKVTGMSIFSVGGNLGFAIGPLLALFVVQTFGFESLPVIKKHPFGNLPQGKNCISESRADGLNVFCEHDLPSERVGRIPVPKENQDGSGRLFGIRMNDPEV